MNKFRFLIYTKVKTLLRKLINIEVSSAVNTDPVDVISYIVGKRAIDCVVDGGAFRGEFTSKMLGHAKASHFHLFEPTPSSFNSLTNRFREHPNVNIVHSALSASSGRCSFHLNTSQLTNSLLPEHDNARRYHGDLSLTQEVTEVSTISLDEYFIGTGRPLPNIIKLDLQGGEGEAIKGGYECLRHASIVLCEVQFVELYQGATTFTELNNVFEKFGFQIYQIFDASRDRKSGRLLFCDILYVKPEYLI